MSSIVKSRIQLNSRRSEMETKSTLKLSRKIGYSIGHANNDLRAVFQLSYILIYFQLSINLEPNYGGYYHFVTQIVDCIMSPIIGLIQDKTSCFNIFGKRMTWYIAGVVLSTVTFGIMFNVTFGEPDDSQLQKLLYFVPCAIFIACGYTFIQLTHLALLPEMTSLEIERIQMNSWRNATTLVCNLLVYCGAWLLLSIQTGDNATKLTSKDVDKFRILSQIIIGLDLFTSLMFCVLVRDKTIACWQTKSKKTENVNGDNLDTNVVRTTDIDSSANNDYINTYPTAMEATDHCKLSTNSNNQYKKQENKNETVGETFYNDFTKKPDIKEVELDEIKNTEHVEIRRRSWLLKILKDAVFYEVRYISVSVERVTIIYSCTKFGILMTQIYLPLYIIETLQMDKVALGILPLILYVSGFITSLLMKKLNRRFGYKKIFIVGEILTLSSCLWIFFITASNHQQIYVASILFGSGQAALNVTSVAMVTDLIGQHVDNSAAVFGIIGFSEKLLQSIFLLIIQLWNICGKNTESAKCGDYFRIVLVSASGITTVIAFFVMAIRQIRNMNSKDSEEKNSVSLQSVKRIQNDNKQIGDTITHL